MIVDATKFAGFVTDEVEFPWTHHRPQVTIACSARGDRTGAAALTQGRTPTGCAVEGADLDRQRPGLRPLHFGRWPYRCVVLKQFPGSVCILDQKGNSISTKVHSRR